MCLQSNILKKLAYIQPTVCYFKLLNIYLLFYNGGVTCIF